MEYWTVEFHVEPGDEKPPDEVQHATRPEAIAFAKKGCDPTRVAIGYTLHRHVTAPTVTTAEATVWNKPQLPA